jgi:hypothetical protein
MTWKRTGNGPETWRVVGVGGKVFRGLYLEVSTSFSQEILSEFGRWDLQGLGSALNISSPSWGPAYWFNVFTWCLFHLLLVFGVHLLLAFILQALLGLGSRLPILL